VRKLAFVVGRNRRLIDDVNKSHSNRSNEKMETSKLRFVDWFLYFCKAQKIVFPQSNVFTYLKKTLHGGAVEIIMQVYRKL
jgi:hypothetical protein